MNNPKNIPLNIEDMFQMYLELMNLKEKWPRMVEVQRIETKRAFYGACGILFVALTDEMTELSDVAYANILSKFQNQISDYWKKEVGGLNFKFRQN